MEWPLLLTQFLAGAAMIALAAWLLWLRIESPVHRSFALYLSLRGLVTINNRVADAIGSEAAHEFVSSVNEYMLLAMWSVLLYFVVVYARPRSWLRPLIALSGVAIQVWYLLDPCASLCGFGPLTAVSSTFWIAEGLVGLWFAVDAVRSSDRRRAASRLVGVGFTLMAALNGVLGLGLIYHIGWENLTTDYARVAFLGLALAAFPALIAAVILTASMTGRSSLLFAGSFAAVASLGWTLSYISVPEAYRQFGLGIGRAVLPALIAVALLRHRLFDVDARLHSAVKYGAIAFPFVAVFFLVEEATEGYVGSLLGAPIGLAASGLLVFILAPLQRGAERIASLMVPEGRLDRLHIRDRHTMYLEQAKLLTADGELSQRDRRILEGLRERLSIPASDASRLEQKLTFM